MTSAVSEDSNNIRKINLATDLDPIAELLELCFPMHLDPDGQTFIREMRQMAQEMRIFGWLSRVNTLDTHKTAGFVWEEDGKIIGNISLIPFNDKKQRIHLIANVAVHPSHRGRGIASALTKRSLGHLRRHNEPYTWLQVRKDNPVAIQLYRRAGFKDEAVRTTWRIRPIEFQKENTKNIENVKIRRQWINLWEKQSFLLDMTYPENIRWNLPVDFEKLSPDLMSHIINLFEGNRLKHWEIRSKEESIGVITWQETRTFANNLWLAISPENEDQILSKALGLVLSKCASQHPISIDYPDGRYASQFENLGFTHFRTLIWMRQVL